MTKINFKSGDSVVVRPNVIDPDFKNIISGWQGRISDINHKDHLVCVIWDSLTLSQMTGDMIDRCEEEGFDWTNMYLSPEDIELTTPRDSLKDAKEITALLRAKHNWSCLGEEGKRIQVVLDQVEEVDEPEAFEAWAAHFQKVLRFPFEAKVSERLEEGPLQIGDKVEVLGIEGIEDYYGILVALQRKNRKYIFPLCDLEVTDKSSINYQPVKDYVVWFASR